MTESDSSVKPEAISLNLGAIEASTIVEDGDLAFLFNLPEEGLALRSAAIVNGTPELRFEASPKVPTLQEQDVAVAFRLAAENERPGFYYTNFPPNHPLSLSRMFMQYSPGWLRWTDMGKLLADVDWIMKCMHIGTRTNENKTVFKSWAKSSNLKDLGTRVDFPVDGLGPTIMSCDHARVQKSDNEIRFPEEPKIKITDGCSSMYSKYITEMLPSIGYHDEPRFLKMQEVVKLVLAVEWLYKEKGVRVTKEWVQMHTSKPADSSECENQNKLLSEKRFKPPSKMVPKVSVFSRPSTDVVVRTIEAEMNRRLRTEYKMKRLYGYCDFGGSEIVMFTEDGTKCPPMKSLKASIEISANDADKKTLCFFVPFPNELEIPKYRDDVLAVLKQMGTPPMTTRPEVPVTGSTAYEDNTDQDTLRLTITDTYYASPPVALPPLVRKTVMTASVEKKDQVFAGMDPNDLIQPEIPGVCEAIIPDVCSWDELFSELSVPLPRVWMCPFYGREVRSAFGGVSAKEFQVREEPMPSRSEERRTEYRHNINSNGHTLAVMADRVVIRGAISWIGSQLTEFNRISRKFVDTWVKGCPPSVIFIFSITNPYLQQEWTRYRQKLQQWGHSQNIEEHFHGTELACDLIATQSLCKSGKCSICGIASDGMKSECIGKNIDFQRFGEGYYLAPNSSKCHDYTEPNRRGYRAMLLCDVLPGEKYKMTRMSQRLKHSPQGYDSVYGEVGEELNYPEIVLYNKRAILPRFIIGYQ